MQRGCAVLGRNIRAGRGEIDLIIKDGSVIVAVEVKTGTTAFEHFTDAKVDALRRTMQRLRPSPRRLDLITVTPDAGRVTIRWYRDAG